MKKILITTVFYPPCKQIGAKRPFKMARYLADSGMDVTVLTVESSLTPPVDHLAVDYAGIKIIRTSAFVPYVLVRNRMLSHQKDEGPSTSMTGKEIADNSGVRKFVSGVTKTAVRRTLTSLDKIDFWSGWRRSALKAIKESNREFDFVLSTLPPYSTAYLGKELAAYLGCKFVLDYRDPWSEILQHMYSLGECSARRLRRHTRIEDACLQSADLILTVSPAITKMLSLRVNKKILTIPQGFSGEISECGYKNDPAYLLYAGNLAYGRDLSEILSALRDYAIKFGEKLTLVYCGADTDAAHQQAASVGAIEYLDVKGNVRECDVADYASNSLCNIVIVSSGYEYSYPGKMFDLISAGRPIYVISSQQSEAGKLVDEYKIGFSFVGKAIAELTDKLHDEKGRSFRCSNKVHELNVENIYQDMINDGLDSL